MTRTRRTAARTSRFERLEARRLFAVVINELLAQNVDGLTDADGDHSDWVELRNTGGAAVDIGGWHLSDDAGLLTKWQFPSPTSIPAGGYLTVFASDKNRTVSGQELHTNFKLSGDGEYLALVQANGTTVESSFNPFPAQQDDRSYGIAAGPSTTVVTLVGDGSSAKVLAPTGPSAATDDFWREVTFNDAAWHSKITGVGFDRDTPPSNVLDPYIGSGAGTVGTGVGDELTTGQMPNTQLTAYIRVPFTITDVAQLTSLTLQMRYDDGFILYLNGKEVLSENADSTIKPVWNQNARANRPDSSVIVPTTYDLTRWMAELREGANVLAIHGMNHSSQNTDFLIDPVLTATRATGTMTGFMKTPTPGANNGAGTLGFVGDTHFSVDRGFFDSPFNVAITSDTPGASIRYTLDGSEPTETTGTLYAGPLNVATTTTLCAIAYKAGYASSNVDTETYIFLDHVIAQSGSGVPGGLATWGHSGPDWSMDPDVVTNPTYSGTIKNDLKAIPTVSVVMNWSDLFGAAPQGIYSETTPWKSSGIERPMSVEYFTADGSEQFHLDGAIEVQGGSSDTRWNTDKLSLELKFKKAYGAADLEYPVYASALFGAGATSEFDKLLLDAQFNYTWLHSNAAQHSVARYVQDQVVSDYQNLISGAGSGAAPHGRWVNLYLNGKYWGIYNLHEKAGDSYAAEYFGGEKEDYDVIKHSATNWSDGGLTAVNNYATLLNATRANMAVAANYQAVEGLLDVDAFLDYMIVHYYAGNWDWGSDNWYATHNRVVAGSKWRFHAWDQEHAFQTDDNASIENPDHNQNEDLTTKDDAGGPTEIHHNLIASPEYKLRFADRVQKHLDNGGQLTPAAAAAVYQARANEIDRAIVGESARWGDNRVAATPYTRANFVATTAGVMADFFPVRTNIVLGQFTARGWLMSLAAPGFSSYGGNVAPGTQVSMTKPAGSPGSAVIYYTTDGSDPRVAGTGALGASAVAYGGPVTLNASSRLRARVKDGGNWSAEIDATFIVAGSYPVRITELHYHPANHPAVVDDEDLEFIELLNTGSQAVNLSGVQITQFTTPSYVFGNVSLAAGERIVVARDPAVFQSIYGNGINLAPGAGYDPGNLSNGGETVALLGPLGETLQTIAYDDIAPWPTAPDGDGPSLEIIDPLGAASDPANWRASAQAGGSPGTDGLSDVTAPTVVGAAFGRLPGHAIVVTFDEAIDVATLAASDLQLQLLPSGPTVGADGVSYDGGTLTATFTFTAPLANGSYRATLAAGGVDDVAGNPLGGVFVHNFIWASGSASADTFRVARDPGGTVVQVFHDNLITPAFTADAATLGQVVLDGAGGAGDELQILGTSGADNAVFDADSIAPGGGVGAIEHAGFEGFSFDGLGSDGVADSLTINGVAVALAATQKLATLTIDAAGLLDLRDFDLVLDYSSVSPIGIWTGSAYDGVTGLVRDGKIASSLALGTLKTLGVAEASDALNLSGTATAAWSLQTVDSTSVLVKYTWGGDATLDGKINIDDYGQIDFNISLPSPIRAWFHGDFNLDGKINIDDYGIIDFNVSQQDQIL